MAEPPKSGGSGGSWGSGGGPTSHRTSSPHIGRVLGARWLVGERIGTGGMATVHAGTDLRLDRPVACKILHAHVAESPEARERLAREARAIAQLEHENVIRVYDYASDDPECTWLVTELVEGGSLRQILDRHDRPLPEVGVMVVTEVARALRAAHAVGVIHRDVKPDNILVGKEGRPKLSDFGIAKVLNESRMTLTGNLVGSPSYMSPEQADGLHTDHRTDLFSAGILLYRMVTGTLPFRGTTPIETIRRVSRGEYQDPVELAPECAGPIAGIIRRALSVSLDDRYQSADELLRDLGRVLQDAGLSATWEELPRFFADPAPYQAGLAPRLARTYEARGKALLEEGDEGRAVDCFNRALSLGTGDHHTLDLVRALSKRRGGGRVRRLIWASGLAAGAVLVIAGAIAAIDYLAAPQPAPAHAAGGIRVEPLPAERPEPAEEPSAEVPLDPSDPEELEVASADPRDPAKPAAPCAPPACSDPRSPGDDAAARKPPRDDRRHKRAGRRRAEPAP